MSSGMGLLCQGFSCSNTLGQLLGHVSWTKAQLTQGWVRRPPPVFNLSSLLGHLSGCLCGTGTVPWGNDSVPGGKSGVALE